MGWTKEIKKLAMARFQMDGVFHTQILNPVLHECVEDGLCTVRVTRDITSATNTYRYAITKEGKRFLNPG